MAEGRLYIQHVMNIRFVTKGLAIEIRLLCRMASVGHAGLGTEEFFCALKARINFQIDKTKLSMTNTIRAVIGYSLNTLICRL